MILQEGLDFVSDDVRTVFLLNSIDGHRVTWIQEIMRQSLDKAEIEFWISSSDSRKLSENQLEILAGGIDVPTIRIFSNFDNLKNAISSTVGERANVKFVSLDGESWLFYKLLFNMPLRILIMRPYLTEKSLFSFIRFLIKKFMIWAIFLKEKDGIRCLSIPGWTPNFFGNLWVDDDLFESNFLLDSRPEREEKENSNQVLVPGYVSLRKNPRMILEAVNLIQNEIDCSFTVKFSGSIQDEVLEIISDFDKKLLSVSNIYLNTSQFYGLIKESLCVVLLYENVGASRIAIESLLLGTPVIMQYNRKLAPLSRLSNGHLVLVKKNQFELAKAIVNSPPRRPSMDQYQRKSILGRSLKEFLLPPTKSNLG
jgi:hypothetical protein